MQAAARLYNRIARSHMYWGRKPLVGLLQVFEDVADGIVLDPFCGAGTPAIAALIQGARVIAADLNPIGPFLTRVLARPLSIPLLKATFDQVTSALEASASSAYAIPCPRCGKAAIADFVVWNGGPEDGRPVAAKAHCNSCGKLKVLPLDSHEEAHQKRLAQRRPRQPYPKTTIHTVSRQSPVPTHDRLFTHRNLALLADLHAAIRSVESVPYREALEYVFTAALYSCSRMQMYSKKDPTSSRGWTALRYYIPPDRKETNVLHAFTRRFEGFLSCKALLNDAIPTARVTGRTRAFKMGSAELLVRQMGWRDCVKRFGESASHVFLDPPYNEDVDYFGFSEFWGAWLGMEFPFQEEWHARKAKGTNTEGLLTHVANSTSRHCHVVLALDPKNPKGWETEAAIKASGYDILRTGFFLYDQSNKAGRTTELLRRRDMYYVLRRAPTNRATAVGKKTLRVEQPLNSVVSPWVRAFQYLPSNRASNAAKLKRDGASGFVPSHLRSLWDDLDTADIDKMRADTKKNRSTYQSFCIALLSLLLKQDGWTLRQTRKGAVETGVFELPRPLANSDPIESAVAVFSSANGKHKMLVFFSEQGEALLSKAAANIAKKDKNKFQRIAVLITPTHLEMQKRRSPSKAKHWRRGFFLCLDELRKRCAEANPDSYMRLCSPFAESPMTKTLRVGTKPAGIRAFNARVVENIQVGGEGSPYCKMQFQALGALPIVPGQFIMMDTCQRKPTDGIRAVPWEEFKTSFPNAPATYLKRPFGVHRAFYRGFPYDYLKHLRLPRSLATITHTVLPSRFDIFYKVLPHGKGTQEMSQLKRRMTIQMLGPLGSRFEIRKLVDQGVDEVHVIGGGVGMAPLIFLVQSFRYFNVPVKAFIGIESTALLQYRERARVRHTEGDDIDQAYAAGVKDVFIYVQDLKEAGIDDTRDIFISYDRESKVGGLVPSGNHSQGFVSDLYARYLAERRGTGNVAAFACGPMPMMKAIHNHTKNTCVDLHVLMEKRMACGIGVCLSCVCRTTKGAPGHAQGYSKVCKDGPIFKANDIKWEKV